MRRDGALPGGWAIPILLTTLGATSNGCGHDYALSPILPEDEDDPGAFVVLGAPAGEDHAVVELVPEARPTGDLPLPGDAAPEQDDPESVTVGAVAIEEREVTLGGGARAEVADYLFVIDGSSSMQRVLGRVLDGFEALAGSDAFPSEARIGVMSTLPADPRFRDRPHPAVPDKPWLRHVPGFGQLVDRQRIARFRSVAPERIAERFPAEGCGSWFAPSETNDDGLSCLVANTQTALYPVVVEAGLTALAQRLDADPPLFRSGAAVNVIVVSDTHDPGVPASHPMFSALAELRPTFEALRDAALARQELASFRIHAIAPAEVCTAEDWTGVGPVYFEAARGSGGETLDVCEANPGEYIDLVRRIATGGAVPTRPVLPIAEDAELVEVLIDGEPTAFTVSADRGALVLPGVLPTEASRITVRYRTRAPALEAGADPGSDPGVPGRAEVLGIAAGTP